MSKPTTYKDKNGNNYKITGGVYTGYTFTPDSGKQSNLGFDHPGDVKDYIDKTVDGNRHFADNRNFDADTQ